MSVNLARVVARREGTTRAARCLRVLSRVLHKRHGKWYAAVEQSGLSGSNFLFSLLIVRSDGVAALGEYGFWFVICQLLAMIALALAVRQMVLQAADRGVREQRFALTATLWIVLALQAVQTLAIVVFVLLRTPESHAIEFAVSLMVYTAILNLSVLFRQYFYMRGRQRLSMLYTTLGLTMGFAAFVAFVLFGDDGSLALFAFWFLALGHGLYLLLAAAHSSTLRLLRAGTNRPIGEVVREYWQPGLPSMGGMAVTWLQNQSVTPLLMLMMGPLAVGYYQLARMVITPVNMVTQGLAMSALPQIRRAWGNGDEAALQRSIAGHLRLSMRVVAGYLLALVPLWIGTSALGLFDSGQALLPMFCATVLVMILSNYRFWYSQPYVVRLEFGFLLRLGIGASALAVLGMLVAGYGLGSESLVILGSAVGEIYLIVVLRRRLKPAP